MDATRPHPDGPAFLTVDSSPLTTCGFVVMLRLALQNSGNPSPGAVTDHSLQRGGAQTQFASGTSLAKILKLGNWSSNAVYTYLPKSIVTANTNPL